MLVIDASRDVAESMQDTLEGMRLLATVVPEKFYYPVEIDPEQWGKKAKRKRKRDAQHQKAKRDAVRAKFDPKATLPQFTSPLPASTPGKRREIDPRMEAIGRELGFTPGKPVESFSVLKRRIADVRHFQRSGRSVSREVKQQKRQRREERKRRGHSAPVTPVQPAAGLLRTEGEDRLSFGAFTYEDGEPVPSYQAGSGRKKNKDVALLRQAEKQREERIALEKTEEGREIIQKLEWDKMQRMATGERVMDDPKLLKKKIKRKEKQKERSKSAWGDRLKAQAEEKERKAQRYQEGQKRLAERTRSKRARRAGFERKTKPLNRGRDAKRR